MRFTAAALVAAFFSLAFVGVPVAMSATNPCSLPDSLKRQVMETYPNARLVTLPDLADEDRSLFQKDHGKACPGLVSVDFYGDGKPTLALVLIVNTGTTVNAELVVAHEVEQKWETVLFDEAASSIPVVWSQGPGNYEDIYGDKTIRAAKPVIVLCGYDSWAILYAWTGSKVDKIWLRD